MDHDTWLLVYHQDVLVLIDDRNGYILWLNLGWLCYRQDQIYGLTWSELVIAFDGMAIHLDKSRPNSLLDKASTDVTKAAMEVFVDTAELDTIAYLYGQSL